MFIPGLGGPELIVLLVIGLLLFGSKLPGLGRTLGKTITEVKNGINGVEDSVGEPRSPAVPVAPKVPQRVTGVPTQV